MASPTPPTLDPLIGSLFLIFSCSADLRLDHACLFRRLAAPVARQAQVHPRFRARCRRWYCSSPSRRWRLSEPSTVRKVSLKVKCSSAAHQALCLGYEEASIGCGAIRPCDCGGMAWPHRPNQPTICGALGRTVAAEQLRLCRFSRVLCLRFCRVLCVVCAASSRVGCFLRRTSGSIGIVCSRRARSKRYRKLIKWATAAGSPVHVQWLVCGWAVILAIRPAPSQYRCRCRSNRMAQRNNIQQYPSFGAGS